jgi:hypothetical protein
LTSGTLGGAFGFDKGHDAGFRAGVIAVLEAAAEATEPAPPNTEVSCIRWLMLYDACQAQQNQYSPTPNVCDPWIQQFEDCDAPAMKERKQQWL